MLRAIVVSESRIQCSAWDVQAKCLRRSGLQTRRRNVGSGEPTYTQAAGVLKRLGTILSVVSDNEEDEDREPTSWWFRPANAGGTPWRSVRTMMTGWSGFGNRSTWNGRMADGQLEEPVLRNRPVRDPYRTRPHTEMRRLQRCVARPTRCDYAIANFTSDWSGRNRSRTRLFHPSS